MSVELQKIAVQEIALLVPQKWDKIQLNIEIDDIEGELVISRRESTSLVMNCMSYV